MASLSAICAGMIVATSGRPATLDETSDDAIGARTITKMIATRALGHKIPTEDITLLSAKNFHMLVAYRFVIP